MRKAINISFSMKSLTCVYLTLKIDLLPVGVGASGDVHGWHVPTFPGFANGGDVANQVRVVRGQFGIPVTDCLIIVLHE